MIGRLLQELADRNYFQVFVRWDKLYFRFPRPQLEMTVLEWGKNLISFSPRLSLSGQHGIQVVQSYNYKLAQTIVSVLPALAVASDFEDIIERLGSAAVDQLVELGRYVSRGEQVSDHLEGAALAKSILQQLLEGLYEGSGSCIGMPQLRAGDMIEIRGVGKRFSGKYRLRRVTHTHRRQWLPNHVRGRPTLYHQSAAESAQQAQRLAAAEPTEPDRGHHGGEGQEQHQ